MQTVDRVSTTETSAALCKKTLDTPGIRKSSSLTPYNQSDILLKLSRPERVTLFRLRTGHNRLNAHMYSKFKVGESETCLSKADIMTAEHLLQHCQLHDALRQDMWPETIPPRNKLYGNLEELGRTAAFVRVTGTSI